MWCDTGESVSSTVSGPCRQSRTRSRALASSVLSECMTHFGAPVVPEVKARWETPSASPGVSSGPSPAGGNVAGVQTPRMPGSPPKHATGSATASAPQPGAVTSSFASSIPSRAAISAAVLVRCSDGLQAKPWREQARKATTASARLGRRGRPAPAQVRPSRPPRHPPIAAARAMTIRACHRAARACPDEPAPSHEACRTASRSATGRRRHRPGSRPGGAGSGKARGASVQCPNFVASGVRLAAKASRSSWLSSVSR